MENLGLIVLRANGDDIFFMLFFICVVVVLAYGIGCLGRKRKIGFGWAFAIGGFYSLGALASGYNPSGGIIWIVIGGYLVWSSNKKRQDKEDKDKWLNGNS